LEQLGRRVDEVAAGEGTIAIMRERELAEQIEAARDDPDAWGDPVPEPEHKRKSERRQRGAMVSVRFSPDELTTVQEHAAEAGMSVSGYLRNLALTPARQPVVTRLWMGMATFNASATAESLLVREEQMSA
jgi:hypothetical protein